LSSAKRSVPHTEEFSAPKSPEYLTFSDNNSDSDGDHGEQEGGNVECHPTFEASCSSSDQQLLTQGRLNDLLRDLNLSKKTDFSGSTLKTVIFTVHSPTNALFIKL
jgi:hypothetical protein